MFGVIFNSYVSSGNLIIFISASLKVATNGAITNYENTVIRIKKKFLNDTELIMDFIDIWLHQHDIKLYIFIDNSLSISSKR